MLRRFVISMISLCVLWTAVPSQSAVVTLTPTADVRILSFFPNSNEGNGAILSVYTNPGNEQRTLLQFDLSGIPNGQQIDSAILTLQPSLTTTGGNPLGLNMDVHAVTKPWTELQVTWNSASTGDAWTNAGGDFDPFVYATSTNSIISSPVTWDVTNLVQDWYDSSLDNDGLLIRSFLGNERTFISRHELNTSLRPALQITYSVPEAGSLMLMGLGILAVVGVARSRRALLSNR